MGKVSLKPRTGKTQAVSISGTTAKTTKFLTAGVVRLYSTVDCFVRFDYQAGTALATDMPLVGGLPEYFNLDGADTVAAITSAATGTLYVTEMA